MNKKGISLVALVITIIVLIILTGAVILTGVNAPDNAATAVKNWNISQVQDAVTIYIMNEIADSATATTVPTVESIITTQLVTTAGDTTVWRSNAAAALGVTNDVLAKCKISNTGVVAEANPDSATNGTGYTPAEN